MKITSEQLAVLESLQCQRLSSDSSNMYLVESFYNETNDTIAQTLKNEAYEEDESKSVAYYVVKHPNGQILFFFSLKCGLLFDHFIRPELLDQLQKLAKGLSDISDDDIVYFREFDSSENKDLFDRWNENSNNALNERWKMIHTQKQRGSRSEWDMKALFKVYSANDGAVILVGIDRNNFEIGSHWGGEDIKRISDRKWRNSFSHRKNSTRYDDDSDTYYYGKRLNDFGIRTNHDLNGKQKDNNELRNRMGKKEWNGDPWEEYQNKRKKHIDDYSRRHYGKGIHQ